jgi:D-proline reductase (dithiol) PrdB
MVCLSDIPTEEAAHVLSKVCAPFDTSPWVAGAPLSRRRVAIVTSAGLHGVGDPAFATVDLSYRVIPGSTPADALTMTHSSVHFDRTGFREDVNVVFPIDRLHELAGSTKASSITSTTP